MKTMNQIGIFVTIFLVYLFTSCKKDKVIDDATKDPNNTTEGLICAVGNPIGDIVTRTIGSAFFHVKRTQ